MGVARVRLVADTPGDPDRGLDALCAAFGERLRVEQPGWAGRRGAWLAYATLRLVDDQAHGDTALVGATEREEA